ncbi:MAG TPA: YggT family protein [Actinomycetes bacterium]|nr:YggT family protein [Actinomycetes bacterium]
MDVVVQVVVLALYLFLIALIARVVLDLVQLFARDYRPTGLALVLFEVIYTVTDPPIRVLRRLIPPVRLGAVSLDLAVLVLFIGVQVLIWVVQSIPVQ